MEEDAGKLIHSQYGDATYPDYNRCGVPLLETVTEDRLEQPRNASSPIVVTPSGITKFVISVFVLL